MQTHLKRLANFVGLLSSIVMKSDDGMQPVRLGQFILQNMEAILQEWEDYARSVWPGEAAEVSDLRDHAELMLEAVVHDMSKTQSDESQKAKSEGRSDGNNSSSLNKSALNHALTRVENGFDVIKLVAEFRTLRATVNRLWSTSKPFVDSQRIEDMLRFNESIDQLIAGSVTGFTERVERSRQLFLGILGHDLRQPLNSMRVLIEMLGNTDCASSEAGLIGEKMKIASVAMAAMLSDLLDFSSRQLGSAMPLRLAAANVEIICQEVLSEIRCAHPQREFQMITADSLNGEWDVVRLRQLVSNLLCNAVQHGSEGPIHLTLRSSSASVEIEVQNAGEPIPSDAFATLFDPMVRLRRSEQIRPHGSMGLGLYICKEIALAHGGTIHVKSSSENGTIFTVNLPKHRGVESSHSE